MVAACLGVAAVLGLSPDSIIVQMSCNESPTPTDDILAISCVLDASPSDDVPASGYSNDATY